MAPKLTKNLNDFFFSESDKVVKNRSESPQSRKVVSDGKNFKVTLGSSRSRTPEKSQQKSNRKVTRYDSRSPSPIERKKKMSIKDRLGPVSDRDSSDNNPTAAPAPNFKNEHWNGKSKPGKNERNGGNRRRDQRSPSPKRDREL